MGYEREEIVALISQKLNLYCTMASAVTVAIKDQPSTNHLIRART
jgi:hypothetical protein